jgi:biopolymer transport protein ExbD
MQFEPIARRHRGLRLAPLVDVVFLLLVFFMLVARLDTPQTIAVEPPSERGGGALEGAVLIRLGADGGLDLNGSAIEVSDLQHQVAPFLDRDPETRFLVQPAFEAPLQGLVRVLDGLRTAGAEDLILLDP